jgi:hypothetical protein
MLRHASYYNALLVAPTNFELLQNAPGTELVVPPNCVLRLPVALALLLALLAHFPDLFDAALFCVGVQLKRGLLVVKSKPFFKQSKLRHSCFDS